MYARKASAPKRFEYLVRVGVVLEPLRHLLAVAREDQSVDDHVLIGTLTEKRGPEHQQRVEPATSLVEPSGDELRREERIELAALPCLCAKG